MTLPSAPKIQIPYKAPDAQSALNWLLLLSPAWALYAPGVLIWQLFFQPRTEFRWEVIIALTFAIAASISLLAISLNNKINLSSLGIQLPLAALFQAGGKISRLWTDINEVRFSRSKSKFETSTTPAFMHLIFNDGCSIEFSIDAFGRADMQNFLLGIQSYAPKTRFTPPLNEINIEIKQSNESNLQLTSFTQIWEDDMNSRFGSTIFIPLEPGHNLLDQKLQIIGQIAFGGLSAIYLAKNKMDQLKVLKEFLVPSSVDEESKAKALQLFNREAKTLMTLKHAQIASVEDCFVEAGRHYLLMEYIDGRDLRKMVREQGPLDEHVVIRFAKEIAQLLKYLHEQEPAIVHRDLTPDNLVLSKSSEIHLIDFGAANQFLGTATGTVVGKQCYIAPEQFRGKATTQSDLYSLGATLFFLLTGTDPEALSSGHPKTLNSNISNFTDELVAKLTETELSNRFQNAEELLETIQSSKLISQKS